MAYKGSYIFLHGAWQGSWVWDDTLPELIKNNKDKLFIAPDLPGHYTNPGDFKKIFFSTYVDYVLNLILSLPKPITLIGHSMAGMIISAIAEKIPNYIESLIYISAFPPDLNGSSLVEEQKKSKKSKCYLTLNY